MNIINTIDDKKFSLNGVEYLRNYVSRIVSNKITVFNCYDKKDILIYPTTYSQFTVNGTLYQSASALHQVLNDVTYTRGTLGEGGGVLIQNNIPRFISFLVPSNDFTGDVPTAAYVAGKLNNLSVNITEIQTPVYVNILALNDAVSMISQAKKHVFVFSKGKGSYGSGGTAVSPSWLVYRNTVNATPDDLEGAGNTVTIDLGTLPDSDYLTAANAADRDLSDANTTYFFKYTTDGVTYVLLAFIGTPGFYGGSYPDMLTEADFQQAASDDTPPVVTPTLDQVLTAGNVSDQDLDIGRLFSNGVIVLDGNRTLFVPKAAINTNGNFPGNTEFIQIGNDTPTDSRNFIAVTQQYDSTGNTNGINVEIKGRVIANSAARLVRGIKGVGQIDPNGFTSTNSGGAVIGVEAVARIVKLSNGSGVGVIDVATGNYARVLLDNDVSGVVVRNVHGVLVPQHSGGLNAPFEIATGITLTEQNGTTRSTNAANLVLGSPQGVVGNLTGLFTGGYNILSLSTYKSYFAGSIGIGLNEPTEKLEVTGNAKINGTINTQDVVPKTALAYDLGKDTLAFLNGFIYILKTYIIQSRTAGNSLRFRTAGGTDAMTVTNATGNVSIGTLTDNGTDKLQVSGNISATGKVTIGAELNLGQFTSATEPTLVQGSKYYNTTLKREMIGTADGWAVVESYAPLSAIKTANYTTVIGEGLIRVNGTFIVTLTTTNLRSGMPYKFKNVGSGVVTLQGQGTATIDSGSSYALGAGKYIQLTYDGANFLITI